MTKKIPKQGQNRTFQDNKKFYQHLAGEWARPYKQPDAREAGRFWSKMWEQKDHNKNAEWINNRETELRMFEEGTQMNIHPDGLKAKLKKMANWKAPGLDGMHGFWFKKFNSIHDRFATEMNKCIQETEMPEWMTKEITTQIQKDVIKGNAPVNYWPITCLSMMWKILTAQIREQIYYSLISHGMFPDDQKGCCMRTRCTEELLRIDQHILSES